MKIHYYFEITVCFYRVLRYQQVAMFWSLRRLDMRNVCAVASLYEYFAILNFNTKEKNGLKRTERKISVEKKVLIVTVKFLI